MYSKGVCSYRLLFPGGEGVVHGAELGLVDRHLRREGCQGSTNDRFGCVRILDNFEICGHF